ncbi:hypothetical protein [Parafrankia discariae]|uniref:hypothetical protein n=1 Tax=Parafrankia discariae TaxID=365528 RepID=UPI0003A29B8C|nr:hypothetical protein [Parafrankia discariae]
MPDHADRRLKGLLAHKLRLALTALSNDRYAYWTARTSPRSAGKGKTRGTL